MNLSELRAVQRTERERDSLQELRPSFYRDVGEYVAELEGERDRLAADADDPFADPEVSRLTDEIETATGVASAVYERRMGKLVKQASLAAAGMSADEDGLTAEERDLFEDLVERIDENQNRVLGVLEGERSEPTPASEEETGPPDAEGTATDDASAENVAPAESAGDGSTSESPTATAVDPAAPEASDPPDPEPPDPEPPGELPDDGGAGDPADERTDGGPRDDDRSDVERLTVKLTADVGSILGVDDREYALSSDDVVTLPAANAAPLVENDAAERLE